ncbi:hypothetical protein [Bradyrhizobium sp.]|uniref:hypothetical protein n=1 Tax=Bradyrhizobium sp. TaxID=376 RepID=UPI0039E41E23
MKYSQEIHSLTRIADGENNSTLTIRGSDRAITEARTLIMVGRVDVSPYAVRIPFDLEAAKRGDALVTRDGRKARFIAHTPEAREPSRVVAFVEGAPNITTYAENGRYCTIDHTHDLFMAPKPKRTIYVNLYSDGTYHRHEVEQAAIDGATNCLGSIAANTIAVAVPIEIDA